MTARDISIATILAAGLHNPNNTRLISQGTKIGYCVAFGEAIRFATTGLEQAPKGIRNASVMAAFAKAFASKQFEVSALEEAMQILCGLRVEVLQQHQPIVTLKEWLLGNSHNRRNAKPGEILGKCLRALVAYQKHESLLAIHAVNEDPFPLSIVAPSSDA